MGRIIEIVVLVNGLGGITATWLGLRARARRRRRAEAIDRAQQEMEKAKQL